MGPYLDKIFTNFYFEEEQDYEGFLTYPALK